MILPHGSTPVRHSILQNASNNLTNKFNLVMDKAMSGAMREQTNFLMVPNWLIEDKQITKKERVLLMMLLTRQPNKKDSSAYQLSRITKESPRTILRLLNNLVANKYIIRTIVSPRVTLYAIDAQTLARSFALNIPMTQATPPKHVSLNEYNCYFHPSILPKIDHYYV